MPPTRRQALWALAVSPLLAAPIGYAALRSRPRNFGVVRAGALYRCGQPTPAALDRLLAEHDIRTVVSLRPPRDEEEKSDAWEETACREGGAARPRVATRHDRRHLPRADGRGFPFRRRRREPRARTRPLRRGPRPHRHDVRGLPDGVRRLGARARGGRDAGVRVRPGAGRTRAGVLAVRTELPDAAEVSAQKRPAAGRRGVAHSPR